MDSFLLLSFIFLIAGIVAVPIATRFGLGSVLGYLLAGMAISPLLRLLDVDVVSLQHFAEFGVVMMLFIVGLELEPRKLWEMRGRLIGLGGGQVLVTTLIFAGISLLNGDRWQSAIAIGMILAVSSTAIILQSLNEKGLLKTEGGQASFSVLLFQDIAVIPMLAIMPLLAVPELVLGSSGHAAGADHDNGISLVHGLSAWQSALVTMAAIAAIVIAGNYLTRPVFRFIAMSGLRELFTATALLFVVGIALLMTLVGLSPALGTFLAGVVLANSEYRHELESDIDPFKGLLLGLFFMTVGAGINFGLLAVSYGAILFWTAVLVVAKLAVLYVLGLIFRIRGQDRWLFALALAQAGEFGFVLLSYARGVSAIPGPLADQLLLVVAMSMLVTPLLFILYDRVIVPRYAEANDRAFDEIDDQGDVIIAGRGRVGGIVDRMLTVAGHRATVIDYSSKQIDLLSKFGIRTYFGDATRPDLLASAGISRAKLLIVAIDDKARSNTLVSHVIRNYPEVHVIARAFDRTHVFELWSLGCRDIVRETYDSSLRIGRSAYEALGIPHDRAMEMTAAFERMDSRSLREVADYYDINVPPSENEAFIERMRTLRKEWDPALQRQMADIIGREDLENDTSDKSLLRSS